MAGCVRPTCRCRRPRPRSGARSTSRTRSRREAPIACGCNFACATRCAPRRSTSTCFPRGCAARAARGPIRPAAPSA
jgi:hypothetical protein